MKRPVFLIVFLLIAVTFSGCLPKMQKENSSNIDSSDAFNENTSKQSVGYEYESAEMFSRYVSEGEYLKAVECYNTMMVGNIVLEAEATNILTEYCNTLYADVLSGTATTQQGKNGIALIERINGEIAVLDPDDCDMLMNNIEVAISSKTAFVAAEELYSLGDYKNAIVLYSEIIVNDSNYAEACNAISECKMRYKTEQMNEAAESVSGGNVLRALSILNDLSAFLGEDSEIKAKITVYEKKYITDTIKNAGDAFVTPKTDYLAALSIINGALQNYPQDKTLLEKASYYQSFAPVYLYDVDPYEGHIGTDSTDEDMFGTVYSAVLYNGEGTYNLDKKYNELSMTIFLREARNSTFAVYGDGILLYKETIISNSRPFEVTVDITGVTDLKIDFPSPSYMGLANAYFQKTVE